jgi:hypothetical protein
MEHAGKTRVPVVETIVKNKAPKFMGNGEDGLDGLKALEHLRYYSVRKAQSLKKRLRKLEKEWDVERMLQLSSAVLGLAGLVLGFKDKRWLIVPGVLTTFLVEQSLHGWSPQVPLLKLLGFRPRSEITRERYALKILRGDFRDSRNLKTILANIKK